ncbi:GNAT family N-acetyltransferase [Flavobacteriaceae bacterium M23B6Z8]
MDNFNSFEELGLGSRLARLSDRFMKEIQCVYDLLQIEFEPHLFPVFKIIADQHGVTNTYICEQLKITQPAVTQSIKKLVQKGYVSLEKDSSDKRRASITLSSKGDLLLKELEPIWTAIDLTVKSLTHFSSKSLLQSVQEIENKLDATSLHKSIVDNYHSSLKKSTEIIPFNVLLAPYFKELNIAWLENYFVVEPYDIELMENCVENIIHKGGYIFFSKTLSNISGTFSLIKIEDGIYELGKMAVKDRYQGLGIGKMLMEFCLRFAKEQNWKAIILYSNTKLERAIHIYKNYGFKEISLEQDTPYLRSNIKMRYEVPRG